MKLSCEKIFWLDVLFCSVLAMALTDIATEQTWTYELKSVETFTSDTDKVSFGEFKIERISRGVYATSGTFTINTDIVEGDNHMIEFHAYRSENGKDYKPIPLKTPRQHLYEYFNTFYKDYVMDSLKECSNMPAFEDEFIPPMEKKLYVLEKCQFDQSAFPQYLQEGLYKIDMAGSGDVEWHFIFVVQVEPK